MQKDAVSRRREHCFFGAAGLPVSTRAVLMSVSPAREAICFGRPARVRDEPGPGGWRGALGRVRGGGLPGSPRVQLRGAGRVCTASQPGSQPSQAKPASQAGGQPARQPASQAGSQPATQPACQPGSQPGSQPTRQPASQAASQPASAWGGAHVHVHAPTGFIHQVTEKTELTGH